MRPELRIAIIALILASSLHLSAQSPAAETNVAASEDAKHRAWQILEQASASQKTSDRTMAISAMGLLAGDEKARRLVERALKDRQPDVRVAAATSLGNMNAKASSSKLRKILDDRDPAVVMAAAHSLAQMHDVQAYDVYYEVLTGQRKATRGLVESQTARLKDPKKMTRLGLEQGIGFIPFATIGWRAVKTLAKDDNSPVRAAAAKALAKDPDPAATQALIEGTSDDSWVVRAGALEALAERGDPSVLNSLRPCLSDEKDAARYTAAATVLRLTAIKDSQSARGEKSQAIKQTSARK